jgi:hypothetical protein
MHGSGVLRLSSGVEYKGTYINGNESGTGVAIDNDGLRYEGTFTEGLRDGKFIVKDANGKIIGERAYNSGILKK